MGSTCGGGSTAAWRRGDTWGRKRPRKIWSRSVYLVRAWLLLGLLLLMMLWAWRWMEDIKLMLVCGGDTYFCRAGHFRFPGFRQFRGCRMPSSAGKRMGWSYDIDCFRRTGFFHHQWCVAKQEGKRKRKEECACRPICNPFHSFSKPPWKHGLLHAGHDLPFTAMEQQLAWCKANIQIIMNSKYYSADKHLCSCFPMTSWRKAFSIWILWDVPEVFGFLHPLLATSFEAQSKLHTCVAKSARKHNQ